MNTIEQRLAQVPVRAEGLNYLSQMHVLSSGWRTSSLPSAALTSTPYGTHNLGAGDWFSPKLHETPYYWCEKRIDWTSAAQRPEASFRTLRAGNTLLVFQKVVGAGPRWLDGTLDRLENLLVLRADDALPRDVPPDPAFVVAAVTFLSRALQPTTAAPSLAPLNDGGLQVEWHRGGLDVEVTFSPKEDEQGVYVRNKQTGVEQELPLDVARFAAAVGDALNEAH